MENFIIEFKIQQNNYVANVCNKLILGDWRTDDLTNLAKQIQTVRLKAKQIVLKLAFISIVLLHMNIWISKSGSTIMCTEAGRMGRFLALFMLELVDRQWGRDRMVLGVHSHFA